MKYTVAVILMAWPALAQTPWVTNTSPLNAANDVAVSADLVVQFSTNVNPDTVTSNRFFAHSARRGYRYGAISFNAATNEATLDLDADFGPGERVFAYVSHGITNAAGSTSVTPHAWSFHTAADGNARFAENGQVFTAKVTSVTLGDVNGNGHLDAVFGVTFSSTNYMRVMTNDGHGVFTMSQSAGAHYTVSAAMADVDGDGDLDLFLAHFVQPATLWLNDGNGTFTKSDQVLPCASVIVPGDFNGDGFCDLAIADAFGDNQVTVCLNDTQGIFTNDVQSYAVFSYTVAVGDMNGDGHLDIVSAGPGRDAVLLNDGTGHFSIGWSGVNASYEPDSIALGDVNGDGHLDQVASGFFGPGTWYGLRIMTNDGSGILSVSQKTGPSYNCKGIALGDLNGNGALDVVLAGDFTKNINTTIWTNDGNGIFSATGQQFGHLGNEWGTVIVLGDVDGDGALDIAISDEASLSRPFWINNAPTMQVLGTNGATIGDPTLLVFEPPDAAKGTHIGVFPTGPAAFTNRLTITNSGPGILRMKQPVVDRPDAEWFRVGSLPPTLPPGGTAPLDIIFAPDLTGWNTLTARVSFVNGAWHPTTHGYETNMQVWVSATGVPPLAGKVYPDAPACDIAHGAEVSLRVGEDPMEATIGPDTLCVYGSQGGVWRGAVSYDAGGRVASLYPSSDYRPGEFITAGLLTTVSNAAGTTRFRPFAWSFHAEAPEGTGYFSQAPDPALSAYTILYGTALGDLNSDGMLDALVGVLGGGGRRLAIAINDGTGRLVERGAIRAPDGFTSIWPPKTLSDLDGDGHIDVVALIVFGSTDTNGLAVWKNDGTGHFTNTFIHVWEGDSATHIKTADVNGDGHMDVVLSSIHEEAVFPPVWLNDGTGRFTPVTHNSSGPMIFPATYWGCEIGDVNGDGAVDLIFGSRNDISPCHMSVWLNDGRGRFTDSGQRLDTDDVSYSVHLGDLNGNGHLDLFAVREADVRIWTNDGAGVFSLAGEVSLPAVSGQYHGQGLADLDGDGDLDAIVGGWELAANKVLLNDGTGQFTISDAEIGNGGWRYSAMGDFTGDGAVDLLMSRVNVSPDLQVWLNKTRPKAGFGKALRFDGVDDCLLMPGVQVNQFSGSNDFTIALWVRPETNGTLYRLFSHAAAEQLRNALSLDATGHVSFALAKGAFSGGSRATSTNAIPWRRWSHVAAVKDGNALRIYLNGNLAGTGVVHATVLGAPATTSDTYIAATALPVGDFFRGDLDEIQIWDTALSAAQLADWMYRAPDRSHPGITNLVAHFDCNEGAALRTTSREGPPIQGNFSAGMDDGAWIDSDVRDWRTWVNQPLDGSLVGSHSDGSSDLAFEIVSQGAFGTSESTGANSFTFTPSTNQLGTNVFTFQVVSTNGMTSMVANAYVVIPPDYDEDFMEDLWEQSYGLDPSDPSDALIDSDDDRFDNLSEFIADTDPTDSNSFFRVTGMAHDSPVTVRFDSSTGRVYTMQGGADLVDGAWSNVPGAGPRLGVGGADSMTDANEPPAGPFYRLGVQLP